MIKLNSLIGKESNTKGQSLLIIYSIIKDNWPYSIYISIIIQRYIQMLTVVELSEFCQNQQFMEKLWKLMQSSKNKISKRAAWL